ncbi:Alpha-galactosidase [Ascochyta lentis]
MVDQGLIEAEYNSIIFDDCFTQKKRGNDGKLCEDPQRFPSGLRSFTNKLEQLGISASTYSDAGYKTFAGYPGSHGHTVVNKQVKFTLTFTRLPKKVGVKPTQVIARLKQVIKQVKSSPQSPTYLLVDNCAWA